jgi:hypothetical protein
MGELILIVVADVTKCALVTTQTVILREMADTPRGLLLIYFVV